MTVWTNGAFDVLHVGHFNLLMFCRKLAGPEGRVIISIDSDRKIREQKGEGRPVFDFLQRRTNLLLMKELNPHHIYEHDDNSVLHHHIKVVVPDYIVVGSDYEGMPVVGSDIATVIYFKRLPQLSTTYIIDKILYSKAIEYTRRTQR